MPGYFVSVPKGLEHPLQTELEILGISKVSVLQAGVAFEATWQQALSVMMYARVAGKLTWRVSETEVADVDALYKVVKGLGWEDWFSENQTLSVEAIVQQEGVTNNLFVAQRVKDAVVDRFREKTGQRPSVDRQQPDVVIQVHWKRNKASVYIDLGGPLHQRGYRQPGAKAPLKENLAAGILIRCGWLERCKEIPVLVDPMCGSGTFLIEGALMALDWAPGLLREDPPYLKLKFADVELWQQIKAEAEARLESARRQVTPVIIGRDNEIRAVEATRNNLRFLKQDVQLDLRMGNLSTWQKHDLPDDGFLVVNPPYGERLGAIPELIETYVSLGYTLKHAFAGWQAAVFTGVPEMGKMMGIRAHRRNKLFNGPIACELLQFELHAEPTAPEGELLELESGGQYVLSEQERSFANRLRKNAKQLRKWLKKEEISCYRIYDADLPDYNAAIDVYEDHLVIAEYAPPKEIDEDKATRRLYSMLLIAPELLEIERDKVHVKVRRRQKGKTQYEKMDQTNLFFTVEENGLNFLINADDYLDTGLFLDHRQVRQSIREQAKDKRFLNLFAYTGTASVYAAAGGAKTTTTVDLSKTYLNWAEENMAQNGFSGKQHYFEQMEAMAFMKQCRDRFDLIFVDPPSFSNSKRFAGEFDVQRDHVGMLRLCVKLLARGGTLIFSNNLRGFKLNETAVEEMGMAIKNITKATMPKDFERNSKIHQVWELTFRK
jgi:23S rRNA (guanine2445-N2)-methyltransferase / 23S rRNA (guanine2069-N7)-methyltransferase